MAKSQISDFNVAITSLSLGVLGSAVRSFRMSGSMLGIGTNQRTSIWFHRGNVFKTSKNVEILYKILSFC